MKKVFFGVLMAMGLVSSGVAGADELAGSEKVGAYSGAAKEWGGEKYTMQGGLPFDMEKFAGACKSIKGKTYIVTTPFLLEVSCVPEKELPYGAEKITVQLLGLNAGGFVQVDLRNNFSEKDWEKIRPTTPCHKGCDGYGVTGELKPYLRGKSASFMIKKK